MTQGPKQFLKRFIKSMLRENAADSFTSKVIIEDFNRILADYYETGNIEDVALPEISDEKCKWLFRQLLGLLDELRQNNIDTGDYTNTSNWGLGANGDLVMFDIGFGNYYDSFDGDPDVVDLSENDETRIGIPEATIQKLLSKLGLSSVSRLGNGNFGDAYDVGGGKVLKVTTDKSEAVNSKKIIGRKLKHIASVYGVRQFAHTKTPAQSEAIYYTILLEKVRLDDSLDGLMDQLEKYFTDARDSHINSDAIAAIIKRNPIAGEILTAFYTQEERAVWNIWNPKISAGEVPNAIDVNDLEELASWIKGAKGNKHRRQESPPSYVINLLNNYLTYSIG